MANRENQSRRGFAAMDEQERREMASRGGRAAHQRGTAHEFDSQEAAEAGRRSHGGTPRYESRYEDYDNNYRSSSNWQNRDYEDQDRDNFRGRRDEDEHSEEYESGGRRSQQRYYDEDEDRDQRGTRGRQGFASMDPEERRELARRGGQASHGGRSYRQDENRR